MSSRHPQIIDGVTQTTVQTMGLGPALATVKSYLAHAQADALLRFNAVNQQQQLAALGITTTGESVRALTRRNSSHKAIASSTSMVLEGSGDASKGAPTTFDTRRSYPSPEPPDLNPDDLQCY